MTVLAIDVLMVLTVACVWLGSGGYARLQAPLDRLHCVAFINVTASLTLALVAFLADGPSSRSFKVLLIAGLTLLIGAAGTHVTGRALLRRSSP